MAVSNSPLAGAWHHLWETRLALSLGPVGLDMSLHHWINDGLMAVFFLVVGLEIKREILVGDLSSPRKAALPVAAAVGGMLAPALIFTAFNYGADGMRGWAIPTATDIAFALGILSLLGGAVLYRQGAAAAADREDGELIPLPVQAEEPRRDEARSA